MVLVSQSNMDADLQGRAGVGGEGNVPRSAVHTGGG